MIDRELLGPSLDRESDKALVHSLRVVVGMEQDKVIEAAKRDRAATDRILRDFHIPRQHRRLLYT